MESPPSIVGSLVSSRSLDSFGLHELVLSNGINVTYKVSGGGWAASVVTVNLTLTLSLVLTLSLTLTLTRKRSTTISTTRS